ncbi:terpene synthase family protein [Paraburkholderia aspalathi]|uniref:terpene synthase family protein n=1 Tax=Paraburkholderia aspalathi TaxID=1324617 RepID=UPI0038B9DF61
MSYQVVVKRECMHNERTDTSIDLENIYCHVPAVTCSGPLRIHTDYPVIDERNANWVRKFLPFPDEEARLRFLGHRYSMLDTMMFPSGSGERIWQISCVTSMFFAIDDLSLLQQVLPGDIASGLADEHPYSRAFSDIWGILSRSMPTTLYRRYSRHWQLWFDSVLRENELKEQGKILDMDAYLALRRANVGALTYMIFAEYLHDLDFSDYADDPDLMRAQQAVEEYCLLVNDLYSYRKECSAGQGFNILASLTRLHGLSMQQAVDVVCARISAADQLRKELCDLLYDRYSSLFDTEQLQTYLNTLGTICAGVLRWTLESPRYECDDYRWEWKRTREITVSLPSL